MINKSNKPLWTKLLKPCGLITALTIVIIGIYLWKNHENAKEIPSEEEYDSEPVLLDCIDFSKNMDDFWGCLVDGPKYFWQETYPSPEVQLDRSQWGIVRLKKRPTSTKKRVQKRSIKNSPKPRAYIPLDSKLVIKAVPVFYEHFQRTSWKEQYNDPHFKNSSTEYLYQFKKDNPNQLQPPWSYDGDVGQKKWHTLQLEKFFVPVSHQIGPPDSASSLTRLMEASLRDHYSELALWKNPAFRGVWINLAGWVFGPGNAPPYVFNFNASDPRKYDSLIHTDPQNGFYSSNRFLLPPPLKYSDLKKFHSKNLLPFNFKMPNATGDDYRHARDVMYKFYQNIIRGIPNSPDPQSDAFVTAIVQTTIDNLAIYFNQFAWGHGKLFQEFLRDTTALIERQNQILEMRSQYSLPLMPIPYPICQHGEPSPFDIIRKNAMSSSLKPYRFNNNINRMYQFIMEFPGDGTNLLSVRLFDSSRVKGTSISMTGGAVSGTELHFETMFIRIGIDREFGSEHRLDGKGYPMELQLLFSYRGDDIDQPYYRTLARQINDLFPFREKLVIMLSVMVEVKPKSETKKPFLFEPLAQVASEFQKQEETNPNGNRSRGFYVQDYAMKLGDFIPSDSIFYVYRGGMTFPPCFSHVIWSIYNETLEITEEQYQELRQIPTPGRSDSQYLAGNTRQIEDEWVPEEHKPGVTPADQEKLRQIRYSRQILKSLVVKNTDELNETYDYYFDYNDASNTFISFGLIIFLQFIINCLSSSFIK